MWVILQCLLAVAAGPLTYAVSIRQDVPYENSNETFLIDAENYSSLDAPCKNSDKTYLIGTQEATWTEAYLMCKENGMELASITSTEEQNRIDVAILSSENQADGHSAGYWLAGMRRGGCCPDFVWLTSSRSLIFRNFQSGQPDNFEDREDCLEAFIESEKNILWNDMNCQIKLKFICQAGPTC